ncbi:MAG: hypothetical protein SCK29_11170 [Bacillota bacterium]|nr:hypothetical protein [Bacillota bacterium]MDW7684665.1 hypothetical protein [Bacillota bacterium]
MLKWDVYGQDEEPVRLPKFFTYVTVAVYIIAFAFVALLWFRWFRLVLEYRQAMLFFLY